MNGIDLAEFQKVVDAFAPGFQESAERFAADGTPFIIIHYQRARDQVFCDQLVQRYRLFWIEDSSKGRLYLSRLGNE